MAHHLISYKDISWIKNFIIAFNSAPKDVFILHSKNKLNHIDELGILNKMNYKVFKKHQQQIIIIDSSILLENPNKI